MPMNDINSPQDSSPLPSTFTADSQALDTPSSTTTHSAASTLSNSSISQSATLDENLSVLLKTFSLLPPGEMSLLEYFGNTATPERELIEIAKQVDIKNAERRKSFHIGIADFFTNLLNSYATLSTKFTTADGATTITTNVTISSKALHDQQVPTLINAENSFNNKTADFDSSKPWQSYNQAVADFNTNIANGMSYEDAANIFNQAAQTYNDQVQAYNTQVTLLNQSIAAYNTALDGVKIDINLANLQILTLNITRQNQGLPPLELIPNLNAPSQTPLPTLSTVPILNPLDPNQTVPSTVTDPPGNIGPVNFNLGTIPSVIAPISFFPDVSPWVVMLVNIIAVIIKTGRVDLVDEDTNTIDLALLFLQKGKVNTQTPVQDVTFTSPVNASGSAALTTSIVGLGGKSLLRILNNNLLKQVVLNYLLKSSPQDLKYQQIVASLALTINQLATQESLLGIAPAAALLLTHGLSLDPNTSAANAAANLSTADAILKLLSGSDFSTTVQQLLSTNPTLANLSPEQANLLQTPVAFSLLLLAGGLVGDGIQNQQAVLQEIVLSLLGSIDPAILNGTPLETFKAIFNPTQVSQQISNQISTLDTPTQENIKNSIGSVFEKVLLEAGLQINLITSLLSSLLAASYNAADAGNNGIESLSDILIKKGVFKPSALQIAEKLNADFLNSLLTLRFGEIAAGPLEFLTQEDLLRFAEAVKTRINGNVPFSDEVQNSLEKIHVISRDITKTLNDNKNDTLTKALFDSFKTFMEDAEKPEVLVNELSNPAKTFIGVMYEGTQSGWKRGSIDIAA